MSLSTTVANELLDHSFGNGAWTAPADWWVQLHYDDPGVDGTANVIGDAGRVQCVNWETTSYGWLRNQDSIEFPVIPDQGANNAVPYATVWTQEVGGTYLCMASLETQSIETPVIYAGDRFRVSSYMLFVQWVGP